MANYKDILNGTLRNRSDKAKELAEAAERAVENVFITGHVRILLPFYLLRFSADFC